MFLRNFNRNSTNYSPKSSLFFTLTLGFVIFGYFYFYNKLAENRYPYFKMKENTVLTIETNKNGQKDTVTWLWRRVNIWRYYGTNLGLYAESKDSLLAEYESGRDYLTAIYQKIPYYDLFDKSGQLYGISIMPANITDSSSWRDENLGLKHKVVRIDTIILKNQSVECIIVETRLTRKAIEIIRGKLKNRSYSELDAFDKIADQSWLNWYSKEHGWLQSVYPDGRITKVLEIENIYWFQRIPRFWGFGVRK